MALRRQHRKLAFQALYQIDARGVDDPDALRASLETSDDDDPALVTESINLALAAWNARGEADRAMEQLAPDWPAHRQAAVDRAILRLAHHEMVAVGSNPKVVVNDAVELAKSYSTEKSPGFVNALLDKILKNVLADEGAA